jgi:Ulp1 family protease
LTELEDHQELLLLASDDVIELVDDVNVPSLHQPDTSPASAPPTVFGAHVELEHLERAFIDGANGSENKQEKRRVSAGLPLLEWKIHSSRDLESIDSSPLSPARNLSAQRGNEAIEKHLRSKLSPDADQQVESLLLKKGIISKIARESVNDSDLSRLLPHRWLNNEVINFYGEMILMRSESNLTADVCTKRRIPNVHYFNTFFWPKLKEEGYEKGRLANWTKKVRDLL